MNKAKKMKKGLIIPTEYAMILIAIKNYGGFEMNWITITLGVLLILVCILIVIVVCLQETKQNGLQGLGSGAGSDSFFSRNKGKTLEAKLVKVTTVLGILFFVLVLAINLVITYVK